MKYTILGILIILTTTLSAQKLAMINYDEPNWIITPELASDIDIQKDLMRGTFNQIFIDLYPNSVIVTVDPDKPSIAKLNRLLVGNKVFY